MNHTRQILFISILILLTGCISEFIPETNEDRDLLVVEGLITDQPVTNTIKLSESLPLGKKNVARALKGSIVNISDDLGRIYSLKETVPGTYITDSTKFQGAIGRKYTLHINTNIDNRDLNYQSFPVEMKPVPPIDSLYYEKKILEERDRDGKPVEGCQIYLNTHDPANNCKFYRWEYSETWEFHIPYNVTNSICWISNNSDLINVKNTSVLGEDRINRYPLNFISNLTDRLNVKYSILVNQYSLSEDEYNYWEKLQKISEQVGGLYDIIPSVIPSDVYCLEDPNIKVLGYFSVSSRSSKRIFIKEHFVGARDLYFYCPTDTIFGSSPIPGLNVSVWVIIDSSYSRPPTRILTDKKGCADCTFRGTNKRPVFWSEGK